MRNVKKVVSIAIMVAVAATFMPMLGGEVSAAAKKPATPKITSATVKEDTVTVKWGKAKNAKKYQVAIRSNDKKWVKYKTVKKTAKNKKKFTKKNKYKVSASGKKYIVYQYVYTYSNKKNVSGTSYTWEFLNYDSKYTFAVRGVNGKKYGGWAAVTKTIPKYKQEGEYNAPGEKVTSTINGQAVNFVIGQPTDVPAYNVPGMVTKATSFNITPSTVIDQLEKYGDLQVEGTTNGLNCRYDVSIPAKYAIYTSEHPTFNPWPKNPNYKLESTWRTYMDAEVYNDNVTIVWTLDGTEPKLGQEDLTIPGSEYPFGALYEDNYKIRVADSIQVRGTVTKDNPTEIFKESSNTEMGRCRWVKVYNGTELVREWYESAGNVFED